MRQVDNPDNSHNMTFLRNIAFDVDEAGFWWDPPTNQGVKPTPPPDNFTNGTTWDSNVAALVHCVAGCDRHTGFSLGRGTDVPTTNVAINNVAVGVRSQPGAIGGNGRDVSGFRWGEGDGGFWTFDDNLAHNNEDTGLFTWQNAGSGHPPFNRFTSYRNVDGIRLGAYFATWDVIDGLFVLNTNAGIAQTAKSRPTDDVTFVRPTAIGSPIAFQEREVIEEFAGNPPVQVTDWTVIDCPVFVDESRHPSVMFEFTPPAP